MGDMDLVRPLGLAGIGCAVVARPGGAPLYSRFARASLHWRDFWGGAEGLADALVSFGAEQPEPPVLFYEEDPQLLLVSRFRERLARVFRFVVADPTLVEDLVDKGRFQALAERHDLPVPAARRISGGEAGAAPPELDLRFPVIVKPLTHRGWRRAISGSAKALQADTPEALRALWPRLAAAGMDLLVQELIPGPETRIESYHVYVDRRGDVVAEFTGRKIRTSPPSCGRSTALTITDAADVAALGRAVVRKLGLRGVAKFDFKRDPEGRLHLLEINPRFNLWHHLGAVAGVNLPALVYADMVGLARPAVRPARAGTCWCTLADDWRAARESGVPLTTWLPWVLRCEVKSGMAWDDPMPFLRPRLSRLLRARVGLRAAPQQA
ncbi:MAG: ATP-grasp domain-containing protein [Gemmatimonadaceae bacterium]